MRLNLENIKLSERSQIQKATWCMILCIWNSQNKQIHPDRKQISGCQRLGEPAEGEWVWLLLGRGLPWGLVKMFCTRGRRWLPEAVHVLSATGSANWMVCEFYHIFCLGWALSKHQAPGQMLYVPLSHSFFSDWHIIFVHIYAVQGNILIEVILGNE